MKKLLVVLIVALAITPAFAWPWYGPGCHRPWGGWGCRPYWGGYGWSYGAGFATGVIAANTYYRPRVVVAPPIVQQVPVVTQPVYTTPVVTTPIYTAPARPVYTAPVYTTPVYTAPTSVVVPTTTTTVVW